MKGWIESGTVPSWGQIEGRFDAFFDEVAQGRHEAAREGA